MTKGSNRTRAQLQFDALPWYLKAIRAADDVARFGANAVTLGYADDIAGYLNGTGGNAERLLTADAIDRAGAAAVAAEALGLMVPNMAMAESPFSATRMVPAAWRGARGNGARLLGLAGDGLTLGALLPPQVDRQLLGGLHGQLLGFSGR